MIRDDLIIGWLRENTERDEILWKDNGRGGLSTLIHRRVRVTMTTLQQRVDSFICLTLTIGPEEISIVEPPSDGIFRKRYDSEEAQGLVNALHSLSKEITRQLERRRKFSAEHSQEIKQKIFKRILSG